MKDHILLLGHGSPKKGANRLDLLAKMLHQRMHPGCVEACVQVAYLQHGEPGFMDAVRSMASAGATRIIVHPFFLSEGRHVTAGIPAMVEEARRNLSGVTILLTEHFGFHESMTDIILERIRDAVDREKRQSG